MPLNFPAVQLHVGGLDPTHPILLHLQYSSSMYIHTCTVYMHVPCMLSKSSIPREVSSVAMPVQKIWNLIHTQTHFTCTVPSVGGASEARLSESCPAGSPLRIYV